MFAVLVFTTAVSAQAVTTLAAQSVIIKDIKGETVGTVTLSPLSQGVKVSLEVHGLSPGLHAMHFHEKGSCLPPKFDSAGGHYAPAKNNHGFDMKGGPHSGDMPNFIVAADGTAKVETVNINVTLQGGPSSLQKPGGTAFVIHEKADDYKTQPSGDAGARIACGEITK